jgi:phage gpG-like protein
VDYYKESFDNEGWEGKKWPEVKRRDPKSPWYGFTPGKNHTEKKRAEGKRKAEVTVRKNFDTDATTRPILHGENTELRDAIGAHPLPGKVVVRNEKPYASVHNNGEKAKVFGKHPFVMPKRQFIGNSEKLNERIREKLQRDIDRILKS